MPMQHFQQDKAIEFNALYNEIQRILRNYQKIGINVKKDTEELNTIKKSCDETISKSTTQMESEIIYQEGISRLKALQESIKSHEVYYTSYNSADAIHQKLNQDTLSKDKIVSFARATIALLNQIESSDTRDYNSEKPIVEKVYGLAYNVIKMELINNGHSTVLDSVRANKTASSYIVGLIEIDIAKFDKTTIANDVLEKTIGELQKDSSGYSYLDEGVILFLAMHDEKNIEKIEKSLLKIMSDIAASSENIATTKNKNTEIEDKIAELKSSIKKSKLYKELCLTISLLALLAGLRYGTKKVIPLIGHNEYKTNLEYYSSDTTKDAPYCPEYSEEIAGFKKTTLTAYDVWRQENIFYGNYNRNIVTYDLTKIDMVALGDFLEYDFSTMKPNVTSETREELSADELYDKAIIEIVRITQDPNDKIFIPNEESQHIFLVTMSTIAAVLGGIGGLGILISIIKKLQNSFTTRIAEKEKAQELAENLKAYKRLCSENEELSSRFLEMYQKFSMFIKNSTIKNEYQRILQLKKQKENE